MKARAFTLIELLIVVAIIAILAAIALPNFLEAQTRSKVSRAKADMRTLVTAIESYHVDNNLYPIPADEVGVYPSPGADPWFDQTAPQILTTPIAYALGVGLCIVRKPGKLPHDTHTVTYELEYGSDSLEIHTDGLARGARVAILDDLLATGGTARAAVRLAETCGASVVECGFLIELGFLGGRAALAPAPVHALLKY